MAAVEITCPHCNRPQKVAEHRLTETVYCLVCQQLITDVYLYKVAPKAQELTIKLKGRIVSEFGTTNLTDLKSKSDDYTGRFEPVDDEDSRLIPKSDDTTRVFDTRSYRAEPSRPRLSTAAKTYLIGGVVVAVLACVVTFVGVSLLAKDQAAVREIDAASADGARLERYPSGAKKAEWRVVRSGGMDLFDGAWQEWHEDGSKKLVGNYAMGNKVGRWQGWHANGQLSFECMYVNGAESGPWLEWHPDGRRAAEGAYVDGKKDGEWRTWNALGGYASFASYQMGTPVGDWVQWHPNGQVKLQGSYVDGSQHGRWVAFYDNGVEERVEYWQGGLLHGPTSGLHRNRAKHFEGNWQDGVRQGDWSWWYDNGRLQTVGTFLGGLEDGSWTEWYSTGDVKLRGRYEQGRRVGDWEEFDEEKSLAARRTYVEGDLTAEVHFFRGTEVQRRVEEFPDGKPQSLWTVVVRDGAELLHGFHKTWYSNGVLAESGVYINGQRDGVWRTWDQAGLLLSEDTWQNGKKQ